MEQQSQTNTVLLLHLYVNNETDFSLGGAEADSDDWEEREALRYGTTVPADAVPAHTKRALLHPTC